MKLGDLLAEAATSPPWLLEVAGDAGVDVASLTLDSRAVRPGGMFACVPGQFRDGHEFAAAAVADGAVALVVERRLDLPVPQVIVTSARSSLGPLADALTGHPSRRLTVVGVTGTNGKTTTCALLQSIFAAHGWLATSIGTLTGARTTPEAPDLQANLAGILAQGGHAVAMEVSSHALDQRRVDATHFAAAVLTNVTQDHLDYHRTMDAYFEAKARLFTPGWADVAIVNADDPGGARLIARLEGTPQRLHTWSPRDAKQLEMGPQGSRFVWDGQALSLALPGRFNVDNAVAAATTAQALGIAGSEIAEGLGAVSGVRGRFQSVDAGQPFTVLVDYAHTPDGLRQALTAARELAAGRVLVVFGAGGDRDQEKRPLMGEAAGQLADLTVVTSDNPRHENPQVIIDAIVAGIPADAAVAVEPDRAKAIATALASARPGDVVLIAGKGHESGQQIGDRVEEFDDVDQAAAALERILSVRRSRQDGL